MEEIVVETITLDAAVNADLSIMTLFLRADLVVKTVMIGLVLASFWSWAIIFEKVMRQRRLLREMDRFESAFWSGGSLDDLYESIDSQPRHPMAAVFAAAMREWRHATSGGSLPGKAAYQSLHQRIERVMHITLGREMNHLQRYMVFLASVGSTSPFVGLFGTVWGIMNSFQSIGASGSTSLVVVAPGIAEALFATALGLVAAIPAVIAYNKLSGDLARYANRLELFAGEFSAILSRQLEEKG